MKVKPGDMVKVYAYTDERRKTRPEDIMYQDHTFGLVTGLFKNEPGRTRLQEYHIQLIGWESLAGMGGSKDIIVCENRLERIR